MFEGFKNLIKGMNGPNKDFANKTVLVVDDNDIDRKLIEKTVERIGCRVITAVDGEIGFHVALSEKPDLILTDCRMPNMDGVQMCKKLRDYEETDSIPIIFLTGVNTPNNVVDVFELDAHDFMCKPINTKLLTSQIETLLKEHLAT